jgi:hypothetical protein
VIILYTELQLNGGTILADKEIESVTSKELFDLENLKFKKIKK